MQIRPEQWAQFEAHSKTSFEDRMIDHIAAAYPVENVELLQKGGQPEVRVFIQRIIERAKLYNIFTEGPVAGLIDLSVVYGQNFESTESMSWTKEILTDDDLAGSSKIAMIFELLPEN